MAGAARRAAPSFAASVGGGGHQRRLGLVEREPFGDNGVVTALETGR